MFGAVLSCGEMKQGTLPKKYTAHISIPLRGDIEFCASFWFMWIRPGITVMLVIDEN